VAVKNKSRITINDRRSPLKICGDKFKIERQKREPGGYLLYDGKTLKKMVILKISGGA
jgi:hypothetical protein